MNEKTRQRLAFDFYVRLGAARSLEALHETLVADPSAIGLGSAPRRATLDLGEEDWLLLPAIKGESPLRCEVVADVAAEPVEWLWKHRVAYGKLTALVGDPGVGKSYLTLDMVTATTLGREPGGASSRIRPRRLSF